MHIVCARTHTHNLKKNVSTNVVTYAKNLSRNARVIVWCGDYISWWTPSCWQEDICTAVAEHSPLWVSSVRMPSYFLVKSFVLALSIATWFFRFAISMVSVESSRVILDSKSVQVLISSFVGCAAWTMPDLVYHCKLACPWHGEEHAGAHEPQAPPGCILEVVTTTGSIVVRAARSAWGLADSVEFSKSTLMTVAAENRSATPARAFLVSAPLSSDLGAAMDPSGSVCNSVLVTSGNKEESWMQYIRTYIEPWRLVAWPKAQAWAAQGALVKSRAACSQIKVSLNYRQKIAPMRQFLILHILVTGTSATDASRIRLIYSLNFHPLIPKLRNQSHVTQDLVCERCWWKEASA